jgi:putative transposase
MQVKMCRAVKYRMYPSETQAQLIDRTIGCARFIYNQMLETRIATYKATGETCNPTPAQYKDRFPFLREVDSLALCGAQMHLSTAYRNFFRTPGRVGFPKFKTKHRSRQTYTTYRVGNNIVLSEGGKRLRLPKVGSVRVRQHKHIPSDWKLKSVTVEHCRSGEYTATILFEYETQAPEPVTPVLFVGLDYASHGLYVSSAGEHANYPRFYRQMEPRLAREQRKLSRMTRGSCNWVKQKRRVAKLSAKVRNQRADFLHKAANQLASQYDCVGVEDLDMQALSQSLRLGKSTLDNGYGLFRVLLAYKLEQQGKRLIVVDKWFPSSQLCSDCGHQASATKDLSVRDWVCPNCGVWHDRDLNAAVNIMREAQRLSREQ